MTPISSWGGSGCASATTSSTTTSATSPAAWIAAAISCAERGLDRRSAKSSPNASAWIASSAGDVAVTSPTVRARCTAMKARTPLSGVPGVIRTRTSRPGASGAGAVQRLPPAATTPPAAGLVPRARRRSTRAATATSSPPPATASSIALSSASAEANSRSITAGVTSWVPLRTRSSSVSSSCDSSATAV